MAQSKAQKRRTQAQSARERSAEMRAAAARAERRRRLLVVAGAVVGVLAVIGVIVAVGMTSNNKSSSSTSERKPVPASSLSAVTSVPQSTLNAVGKGSALALPKSVSADPLTADGKPEVLYVGAEYCPFCAGERWAMVQALSRFGTFKGLTQTTSAAQDVHPNTPTFSFHGATYTSDYLSFVGKELQSNKLSGGSYEQLDTLTPAEEQLFKKYSSRQSYPFVFLGGRYVVNGAQYDTGVLQGKTFEQIADSLADPADPIAKSVDGTANTLTAALCKLTGGKPTDVCSSPSVTSLQSQLGG